MDIGKPFERAARGGLLLERVKHGVEWLRRGLPTESAKRVIECIRLRLCLYLECIRLRLSLYLEKGKNWVEWARWRLVIEPGKRGIEWMRCRLTFFRLHVLYFITACLLGTLLLYFTPKKSVDGAKTNISFIDAFFISTSAVCVTGLSTLDMRAFTTFDLVVIMLLIAVGGGVLTSLGPVLVRRHYFRQKLRATATKSGITKKERPLGQGEPIASIQDHSKPPATGMTFTIDDHGRKMVKADLKQEKEQTRRLVEFRPNEPGGGGGGRRTGMVALKEGEVTIPGPCSGDGDAATSVTGVKGGGVIQRTPSAGEVDWDAWGKRMSGTKANQHGYTWGADAANIEARKLVREVIAVGRWREAQKAQGSPSGEAVDGDDVNSAADEDPEIVDYHEIRSVEYLALNELSKIIPLYYFCCQFFASLIVVIPLRTSKRDKQAVASANTDDPYFFSLFHCISSFNNAGFGILPDNMVQFRSSPVVLLTLGALILLGNTMFAPAIRGIIMLLHRYSRKKKHVYKYLLDHPRKCFTHLFPAPQTKWLVIAVIAFNGFEWFSFLILDWWSQSLERFSSEEKVLAGLFQAVSTRNAGMQVVNIALLNPAMVVLYCGLMYTAVYPVFLARQQSKSPQEAYDDADIGVLRVDWESEVVANSMKWQATALVGHDAVLLFLSVFIICAVEADKIRVDSKKNDFNFAVMNIIFEVISGFGNVGLSTGYMCMEEDTVCQKSPPNYSLSGRFSGLSKLVLVFVMFLGRHRGLPDNIDAAIKVPTKQFFKKHRRTLPTNLTDPASFLRELQGEFLLLNAVKRSGSSISPITRDRLLTRFRRSTSTPVPLQDIVQEIQSEIDHAPVMQAMGAAPEGEKERRESRTADTRQ